MPTTAASEQDVTALVSATRGGSSMREARSKLLTGGALGAELDASACLRKHFDLAMRGCRLGPSHFTTVKSKHNKTNATALQEKSGGLFPHAML